MSEYQYQDAYILWEILRVIDQSPRLQRAMTLRFELDLMDCPSLPVESSSLLFELNQDELVKLSTLQASFNRYISSEKNRAEWTQQLGALNARLRTLEMRARNVEQELSKSGLFRGRSQKELSLENQRLSDQRIKLLNEIHELQSKLESIETHRRQLGEQINSDEMFSETRWVIDPRALAGGIAVELTPEGRFLFEYLSEMKPEALKGKALSHALIFGSAWSLQLQS